MAKPTSFDLHLLYEDGEVHVTGSVVPGVKGTMIDPPQGPEIEDFECWKVLDGEDVETEEADEILEELYDTILERVAKDGPDPDARRDAQRAGD